jgi:cytochrome P450
MQLRRLVSKAFTPRMVAQLEPHIRAITTGLIDAVAMQGRCDFVAGVAGPLPMAVICEMVGVPRSEWQQLFQLTNTLLGSNDPKYRRANVTARETHARAQREIFNIFSRLVTERRRERRDDLLSALIDAEVEGERLTDEELHHFCFLLIGAGNETTRNAASGGLLALIEHPEERVRLLTDPSLLPTTIEEILRWTSPVRHVARLATRDVEIGGQTIRAGERVVLWFPSANRDEAVFPDADRFDIGRTPNEHLAFGVGEHFCLGAGLARLELRVLIEEVLRRLPDIGLAGSVRYLRSTFLAGITDMPIRFGRITG